MTGWRAGLGTAICAPLFLSACATPETRLRNALGDLGLAEPVAACMADRMVDRLSWGQLRRLSTLSEFEDKRPGDLSIAEFVRITRGLHDPEVIGVVTSSGAICALRG